MNIFLERGCISREKRLKIEKNSIVFITALHNVKITDIKPCGRNQFSLHPEKNIDTDPIQMKREI
jgi:hypothetical protein